MQLQKGIIFKSDIVHFGNGLLFVPEVAHKANDVLDLVSLFDLLNSFLGFCPVFPRMDYQNISRWKDIFHNLFGSSRWHIDKIDWSYASEDF